MIYLAIGVFAMIALFVYLGFDAKWRQEEKLAEQRREQIQAQRRYKPPYMTLEEYKYMNPPFRHSNSVSKMKDYVVFDFETTGTDAKYCEIIEIGAIKVLDGQIIEKFESFVKPYFRIPDDAIKINHITNEMVSNAPPAEKIIPAFLEFIGDSKLIGYNIKKYDFIILRRYAVAICGKTLDNMITDVYIMARKKLAMERYRLIDVAKHFKIDTSNAHRAIGDCVTTFECFKRLQQIYKDDLQK